MAGRGHQTHLQRPRQPFRSESKQGTGGYDQIPSDWLCPRSAETRTNSGCIFWQCALYSPVRMRDMGRRSKNTSRSVGPRPTQVSHLVRVTCIYVQLIPHPHSLIRILYNLLTSPPWLRGGCSILFVYKFYPGGSTRHSFSKAFPCKHQPAIPAQHYTR